jgi:hypothetical protein
MDKFFDAAEKSRMEMEKRVEMDNDDDDDKNDWVDSLIYKIR